MSELCHQLVREISAIEDRGIVIGRCHARKEKGDYTQSDASLEASMYDTNMTSKERLREALAAADAMAARIRNDYAPGHPAWAEMERYRAATRTEE